MTVELVLLGLTAVGFLVGGAFLVYKGIQVYRSADRPRPGPKARS